MKKKVVIVVLSILFVVVLTILTAIIVIKNNKITVSLNGPKIETINVFSSYKDKGVSVKKGNKELSKDKYTLTKKNSINQNIVGKYDLHYKVKVKKKEFDLQRTINVVDNVAPELNLSTDVVERDFCTKKETKPITFDAVDNYDGDLTKDVIISETDDKIIYSVKDASGNEAKKEVSISYSSKPKNKFVLNGKSKVTVIVNKEYKDQGASYVDGCGKKLDANITVSGTVNTAVEGTYTLTYSLKGEEDITRTVVVTHYSPKTIYLTFDDGPGANTRKVLDTLDKYGVKATFFVTNQFGGGKYQYLIKEEHDKGHAVGVHTLTHSWNVYNSLDDYLNDFNAMNEIVKAQTGSYTKIFRFPGGSGNTVSRSHSQGVVTAIAEEMTNRGYVYFDWNLSSGDAASGKVPTDKIVSNVLNNVDRCNSQCVILFHDYKKTTADAVEPIVKEFVERGYSFATLDENGPVVHAKIKN